MAVPVKDDEGLVGEVTRGFINFEGRTLDDCLAAIEQAVGSITAGFTMGKNYRIDELGEVGYYSFEVSADEPA